MNEKLKYALEYSKLGWHVILLHSINDGACTCARGKACAAKGKHPIFKGWSDNATTSEEAITSRWTKNPNANIGIATGKKSGILVLDIDPRHDGDKTLNKLERQYGTLPQTVTALTGGGGQHRIFKYPTGIKVPNKVNFAQGLDTRSDGGMIVAAPSIHSSGNQYMWLEGHSPFDIEPAEAPAWLINLMVGKKSVQLSSVKPVPEGNRNNHLTSLAGTLRRKGMSEEGIIAALLAENRTNCEPPLEEKEVLTIAKSISRYEPHSQNIKVHYNKTDSGNTERFRDQYRDMVKYSHTLDKWYIWNGKYWEDDERGRITELALKTIRSIVDEANSVTDEDARRELIKHSLKSENISRLKAMLSIASDLNGLTIKPEELDADIWKLNCKNGVLDLKTGELLPHDKKYLMTKICNASYDEKASAPTWLEFLNTITNGSKELMRYLQKAIGCCLTGDVSEQSLFILYGTGSNGKSTFIRAVTDLLGNEYAQYTQSKTLMEKKNDTQSNDLACLRGARLVAALELDENQRLSEGFVKSLTGGDKVKARFLYSEYFIFMPQFKIFLSCNHKPIIKDTTHSFWRRVKLIPFAYTVPEDKKDKQLPEKLSKELDGILTWAVEGCMLWQKEGLTVPSEVKAATEGYRDDMDTFSQFLGESCDFAPEARVANKDLRVVYEQWCRANGEYPVGQKVFSSRLIERGFANKRSGTNGSREWQGIKLKADIEPL